MSKLNIRLSYKNACILKHALRNKIAEKEQWTNNILPNLLQTTEKEKIKILSKLQKEIEEEKRALAAITEEIERATERHGRSFVKRRGE